MLADKMAHSDWLILDMLLVNEVNIAETVEMILTRTIYPIAAIMAMNSVAGICGGSRNAANCQPTNSNGTGKMLPPPLELRHRSPSKPLYSTADVS